MGKGIRYSAEFKQEAVNQVIVHGYSVLELSQRLGVSNKSIYVWIKRLQQERNTLKKAAVYFVASQRTIPIDLSPKTSSTMR